MLKVSMVVLAVGYIIVEKAAAKGRIRGLPNKRGLERLLKSLDNEVYATCEMVFFPEPDVYYVAAWTCNDFRLGGNSRKKGNLATVDSSEKSAHLSLLHNVAYPLKGGPAWVTEDMRWAWIGLQKVQNNDKQYYNRNALNKEYDFKDWRWMGTRKSPRRYKKWSSEKDNAQPAQLWVGDSGEGREDVCRNKEGCFKNQVKVNQATMLWEDTYDFEFHPYACDYKGKYIISNLFLKWTDAVKACKAAGLTLATVRSMAEVKELKKAIEIFLGEGGRNRWDIWDARNWLWLGGNDLDAEGDWRWLNGDPVETWNVPWKKGAGKDNRKGGQHALAFSRWGQFDDSHHDHEQRTRNFACECPR